MKRKEKTIIGQTAVEYCERYPEMPSQTLAKIMAREQPRLFKNWERARDFVRDVRGLHGKRRLSAAINKRPDLVKKAGWNAAPMPKSTAEIREDYHFPTPSRVLVLSDIHFPFHNEEALAAAIEWGKSKNPTHVLLNGDTVENYGISRWEPDPRKRDYPGELSVAREGVKYIRGEFPDAEVLFKSGNHEDRLEKFLISNASALLGVEDFEIQSLLRLSELSIGFIASKQVVRLGGLVVIHGHELPRGLTSSVNPARGLYLKLQETSLCGHFHQTSHHSEASGLKKRYTSCYSTGCLCDLTPDYAIVNKWNHGCAFVEVFEDGNFKVENVKIINGQVY